MSDFRITKTSVGVAKLTSTDPFSTLAVFRIDRRSWEAAPESPGVYLLYGFVDGEPAAYVGMSTTSIRSRVRSHHVSSRKNWFGVLFAVPLPAAHHCAPIEAELIRRVREAEVVNSVENRAAEQRFLDVEDDHVEAALEGIVGALEMLLGSDIFTPQDTEEARVDSLQRAAPLARVYHGQAEQPRPRASSDPAEATHAYVGAGLQAWGCFESDEPDKRFRVLAGSAWRRAAPNPDHTTYELTRGVLRAQDVLVEQRALDADSATFTADHVFLNWTQAVRIISGKGQYSGGYHWQRLG